MSALCRKELCLRRPKSPRRRFFRVPPPDIALCAPESPGPPSRSKACRVPRSGPRVRDQNPRPSGIKSSPSARSPSERRCTLPDPRSLTPPSASEPGSSAACQSLCRAARLPARRNAPFRSSPFSPERAFQSEPAFSPGLSRTRRRPAFFKTAPIPSQSAPHSQSGPHTQPPFSQPAAASRPPWAAGRRGEGSPHSLYKPAKGSVLFPTGIGNTDEFCRRKKIDLQNDAAYTKIMVDL